MLISITINMRERKYAGRMHTVRGPPNGERGNDIKVHTGAEEMPRYECRVERVEAAITTFRMLARMSWVATKLYNTAMWSARDTWNRTGQDTKWFRPSNGSPCQPISRSVARPHLSASGASGRHGVQIVVCAEKEGLDGTSSRIQKEGNIIIYDVH